MTQRGNAAGRDGIGLRRRLRREAARSRPAFSSALQERILAAVDRERRDVIPGRAPWFGRAGAVAAALALVLLAAWPPGREPRPAATPPAAVAVEPSLDALPSIDEIGDELLAASATLAAEAVGLPRWNDLVDVGRFVVAPGDPDPVPLTP